MTHLHHAFDGRDCNRMTKKQGKEDLLGVLRAGLTARPLWILRHEVNGYRANLGGNIPFTQYQRDLTACTAPITNLPPL